MRNKLSLLPAAVFLCAASFAGAGEPWRGQTEKAAAAVESRLDRLRTDREDLAIPSRWPLPLTLAQVENIFLNPLQAPRVLGGWSGSARLADKSADYLALSAEILGVVPSSAAAPSSEPDVPSSREWNRLPESLRGEILKMARALESSRPLLRASYESLSFQERQEILALYEHPSSAPVYGPFASNAFKRKIFKSMERLDPDALLGAACAVAGAVDASLPELSGLENFPAGLKSVRVRAHGQNILVSLDENAVFEEKDLRNTDLLLHWGRNSFYSGPAAGAGEGEIKVIVDFAEVAVVRSTSSALSCGAGAFGIGLMYLPSERGIKDVLSGSFSQGAGLAGVGGFFARGPGTFQSERYAQGFSVLGAGIFANEAGPGSRYQARRYAQGVGFTRGAGIFKHAGSESVLRAGLTDPDPREPLGTTSLCQGVGYGPRGFAGGGVGLCVLKGDRMNLESSYFSQGAGYWHAAGAFLIEGDGNRLKTRRYSQGAGVHNAAGAFFLFGNENDSANWGVGPAYGWDAGLAWVLLAGNRNRVQAEWGAGTASYNRSRSFSVILGDENRLDLPGWGSGNFNRDLADYALAVIEGKGNRLKKSATVSKIDGTVFLSPWGLLDARDLLLEKDLGLDKPVWDGLERETLPSAREIDAGEELKNVTEQNAQEKIGRLIKAASAFSADKVKPREALMRLALLPDAFIPYVLRAADPADLEGFIQIRTLVALWGDGAWPYLASELSLESDPERRAWLLSLLTLLPCERGAPVLLKCLDEDDARIQSVAARSLGALLDGDQARAPGRRHSLETLGKWLGAAFPSKRLEAELVRQLSLKSFADALSLLSLAKDWSAEEKIAVLSLSPGDIGGNLEPDNAKKILEMLTKDKKNAALLFRKETGACGKMEGSVREKLTALLEKSKSGASLEPAQSLLLSLGHIGAEQDASVLAPWTEHRSAWVRESALASLGRIGRASLPVLNGIYASREAARRAGVLTVLQNASDPKLLSLLEKGLRDPDPLVCKTALSAAANLPQPLESRGQKLRKKVKKAYRKPALAEAEPARAYLFGD